MEMNLALVIDDDVNTWIIYNSSSILLSPSTTGTRSFDINVTVLLKCICWSSQNLLFLPVK